MTLNVALRSLWPAEFSSCPNSQLPCHRWFDFSAWILEKFLEFTKLGYMLGIDYSVLVLSRTYCVLCFIDSVLHVRKLFLNHYNFFLFLFWILYLKDTDHPCYFLHNKLPQNLVVNSTHLLYRHFCGSGIQHDVAGPSASVSHKATFKVSAESAVSSEAPTGEGSASKCSPCLLAALPPWGVVLTVSVLCWLLSRGHALFLATWASPTWQFSSSKHESQKDNREHLLTRQKSWTFVT